MSMHSNMTIIKIEIAIFVTKKFALFYNLHQFRHQLKLFRHFTGQLPSELLSTVNPVGRTRSEFWKELSGHLLST